MIIIMSLKLFICKVSSSYVYASARARSLICLFKSFYLELIIFYHLLQSMETYMQVRIAHNLYEIGICVGLNRSCPT